MSVSPFDSALLGNLFSDPEIAALFDDRAQIASMLLFESALAAAEARAGVIPEHSAARIADVCHTFSPDPASLADGTASAVCRSPHWSRH